MALNYRQRQAYQHRCDLFRPADLVIDNAGRVDPASLFSLQPAYTGVRCRFQETPNISDPVAGVGRGKRPSIFTLDSCVMDVSQEIEDGWIVRDATPGPRFGQLSRVQGAPKLIPKSGVRDTNYLQVMLFTVELAPPGVS